MKKILMAITLTAITACTDSANTAFARCNRTTAFKSGEYQDAQRNVKVCVYQAFGKNYTYAVASYGICPVSIEVCAN